MSFTELTTTMGPQQGCDEINARDDAAIGHVHDGSAFGGGPLVAPGGNITSSTVQGAITELDSRIGANPSYRNKLINGNFEIFQRGTSFTINNSSLYTLDRWLAVSGNGGICTVSQNPFVLGQTDVHGGPKTFLQFAQTTGGTTAPVFGQRIESALTLSGNKGVLSFWARVTNGTLSVTPIINQNFGGGGSPSATVSVNSPAILLTSIWQKFTVDFAIPSVSGKTLGSLNNDYFTVALQMPVNTIFTMQVAMMQFEEGIVATPFEQRPSGLELLLCQRYYENGYTLMRAYQSAGSQLQTSQMYKVTKKTTPTIVTSNVSYSSSSGLSILGVSYEKFYCSATATYNADSLFAFNWYADAEL